jgi:hypothetical protein
MVIVHLKGGLGNQLFQYAVARQIAHNHDVSLKLDLSFLLSDSPNKAYTHRDLELNKLNINAEIATEEEIQTLWKKRWQNLFQPTWIKEHGADLNKKVLKASKSCYLDGFWQSEKYFLNIQEIIRKEFSFKELLEESHFLEWIKKIKSCNSVSIHFRRGDYVQNAIANQYHGVCSIDYYQKSVQLIFQKVLNPVFFVFSDDIQWVKNNFWIDFPVYFVEKSDENRHSDFQMMSLCKHNIIANSSYSWWAAWLNSNENKIVISPEKWFENPYRQAQIHDLIPEKWIKM